MGPVLGCTLRADRICRHSSSSETAAQLAFERMLCTNSTWYYPGDMRRAAASGIVVLVAAIISIAVIASSHQADDTTELLKLLPNGMPDISGIQTGPPTRAQIMDQMKKDGLSLDLFKQVPCAPQPPTCLCLRMSDVDAVRCVFTVVSP